MRRSSRPAEAIQADQNHADSLQETTGTRIVQTPLRAPELTDRKSSTKKCALQVVGGYEGDFNYDEDRDPFLEQICTTTDELNSKSEQLVESIEESLRFWFSEAGDETDEEYRARMKAIEAKNKKMFEKERQEMEDRQVQIATEIFTAALLDDSE